MKNLIKYEIVETKKILILSAEILAALELLYIFSSLVKWTFMYTLTALIMGVFIIVPVLFPVIYSLNIYNKDIGINHNKGYMLLMTSNSPKMIIGAKISASMLLCIVFLLIMNIGWMINSHLPVGYVKQELIDNEIIKSIFDGISEKVSFGDTLLLNISIIFYTVNIISVMYAAKMLGDSIFAESENRNMLTFVSGLVLMFISGLIILVTGMNCFVKSGINEQEIFSSLRGVLIVSVIINGIFAFLEYYLTTELFEKKFEIR